MPDPFCDKEDGPYAPCGQLIEQLQIPAELEHLAKTIEETCIVAKSLLERLQPVTLNLPRACGDDSAVKADTLAPLAEQIRHNRWTLAEGNELLRTILSTLQV